MTSSTLSSKDLKASLDVIEVKPGVKFSRAALKNLLPDVTTALFFGKVYELDYRQLSSLLSVVLNSDLARALLAEGGLHSNDLQDYLVGWTEHADDCYIHDEDWHCSCGGVWHEGVIPEAEKGAINFAPDVPKGEILPELWASLEVEVAASIKAVTEKLESVVHHMPGKQGEMLFRSLKVMNAKRPTIGDFKARIHHAPQAQNLVILDVSGSMTPGTVQTIVDDVVAMSYAANAHLAIVSNTAVYWEPGSYGTDDVLAAAQYGGTHYEQLAPLFDRDWGVVVTVADYDSSYSAKDVISRCTGRIDEVLDISLVDRPTYLAEVVGQLADQVRPLLVAAAGRSLCGGYY